MKLEKKHYIIAAIIIAIIAIWYFFLRKKSPAESSWVVGGGDKIIPTYSSGTFSARPMTKPTSPSTGPAILPTIPPDYTQCEMRYNMERFQKPSSGLFAWQRFMSCKTCTSGCYDQYNKNRNGIRVDLKAAADFILSECKKKCVF